VRDIFRKLASALHPDRETDSAKRGRKTALMQRANVAYAANDLLGLLELQLEANQIDQTGLDNLDDDRIKQYNRILDGQAGEIKAEIIALETSLLTFDGWCLNAALAHSNRLLLSRTATSSSLPAASATGKLTVEIEVRASASAAATSAGTPLSVGVAGRRQPMSSIRPMAGGRGPSCQ
jgi:hypothetical protein